MAMNEEMIALINAMQSHRDKGGSPFDCPSLSAPDNLKKELSETINVIFIQEMNKHGIKI